MKPIAAIVFEDDTDHNETILKTLAADPLIDKVIVIHHTDTDLSADGVVHINTPYPLGGDAVMQALNESRPCPFVLIIFSAGGVEIFSQGIERLLHCARDTDAGLCYADYFTGTRDPAHIRSVIDYQLGSIRDDFSFGPLALVSRAALDTAMGKFGPLSTTRWGGLYELRLKISRSAPVVRIPEPLSMARAAYSASSTAAVFHYVDPARQEYQKEMEKVATEHLKHIGAYIAHGYTELAQDAMQYPVEASVVIPVRNRERTITDAITSALSQQTPFPFNVIVVQNHSTDKTGAQVTELSKKDTRVIQIIPHRTDLGIGGCWNEAVRSAYCGRFVCQLDSDDLYADKHTLATIVSLLQEGRYGMVVGTYRVVNFSLEEIPPGLVEHREWSEDNGRNNLLRVHGIGAPRAFPICLLRQFPFPNVSYGEDYAMALRISREYRVGRIFKPLYLCRRWEENSDANLSWEQHNRYATYKDGLRTQEILERIRMVSGKGSA